MTTSQSDDSQPTVVPAEEATASPTSTATALPPHSIGQKLFDFAEGEPGWYTVDDDVMGGVSSSQVARSADDRLYFSGTMSLENNGGFSSVRSDWNVIDLSGTDGVLMRVRGDGQIYRLRIRTQSTGSSVSYNALFETTADEWRLVYVPFEQMVPTIRGFTVDAGPLDTTSVASFGFMLSDKQPGDFSLEVDWMRALSQAELESQ